MKKLRKAIKKNLIAGLLVTVPVALTYMVLAFVIRNVDRAMNPIIVKLLGPAGIEFMEKYHIPGMGTIVLVLFIILVGLFGTNFFGRKILQLGERILHNIPFVRVIYTSIKKVVDTVSQTETPSFQQMVLLTYPRPPLKALGIVCGDTKGDIATQTNGDTINVFVPTSPNPTTGFLLLVPRRDLVFLKMTVEDGLKMIISFGMVGANNGNVPEDVEEQLEKKSA